jgi:hypothetical protein
VLSSGEQSQLKLTTDQKKDVAALQKAVDARFEKVLTEAQRKQIKSVFSMFSPPPPSPVPMNPTGPHPGKVLTPAQQETLKLSAEQKKRMEEIQKEIDAKLDTLLTEDQKKQLQTMRQSPPTRVTAGAAGPPPGRVPPGGTPLFRANRYAVDFPGFAGKKLEPGKLLEEPPAKAAEKKVAESKK